MLFTGRQHQEGKHTGHKPHSPGRAPNQHRKVSGMKINVNGYTIKPRSSSEPFDSRNIIIERNGRSCQHGYQPSDQDKQTKTPEQIGQDILSDFYQAAYFGSITYQQYISLMGEYEDSRESHAEYKRAHKGLLRLDPTGSAEALKQAETRLAQAGIKV